MDQHMNANAALFSRARKDSQIINILFMNQVPSTVRVTSDCTSKVRTLATNADMKLHFTAQCSLIG